MQTTEKHIYTKQGVIDLAAYYAILIIMIIIPLWAINGQRHHSADIVVLYLCVYLNGADYAAEKQ